MNRSRRLLAVLLALAMFTAACGGDDDDTSAADDASTETDDAGTGDDAGTAGDADETSDDTTDDDASTTDDSEPPAAKTDAEILAASQLALPDDFTIDSAAELEGEFLFTGAYSGDPQGPVATMTAAGWTHLGTRDGSFIMDFEARDGLVTCAIVYALISGAFGVLVSVDSDDCETYSSDNASRAKEAAEGSGATAAN